MQLTELKGIGPKTEELFFKLGVHNVEELLEFFPRDYELFFCPVLINDIGIRTFATIKGAFTGKPVTRRIKNLKITTGFFKDETGTPIKAVWFNFPYIADQIKTDQLYILRGRISQKYGVKQIDQPKLFSVEDYGQKIGCRQPVYPLTKGINNNTISKAVRDALETDILFEIDANDPVPYEVRRKYDLCTRSSALKNMHFPGEQQEFAEAVRRMAFEELFLFLFAMKSGDDHSDPENGVVINEAEKTAAFKDSLPYELTGAQRKVYKEITADMSSGKLMNRLVQGDVGSGKTIIALMALMNAAFAGYQGALMAPTEVLAAQHYESITALFRQYDIKLNAALLTGSMTALEKKVVYDALKDGRINIIIGTHALIQEKVVFKDLALVVTDEQHRFGIKQRQALAEKAGRTPHVIVMSATPIPRTLALILYGGMDVSVIDELPSNRKPIKNAVIDESFRDNAYKLMKREISRGHQVYIICPLVEYSEGLDAQNVTDYSAMLKEEVFNDGTTVGMLHGQMPASKKNEIMKKFADGDIQVLVSTTVIEVGVNVPNATVMMIEDADRFGLAALHQLRGRVGRGGDQSYCMFMSGNTGKQSIERLNVLKESNDGFNIASKDLKLRGPGEFTGIRQSGMLSFKCFDIYRDADMIQDALDAAAFVKEQNIKMPDMDIEHSIVL